MITLQNYEKQRIYANDYITMFYKDSEKLENTRKNEIPMPHNQGVAGSCPAGTTKKHLRNSVSAFSI